MDRQEVRPSLFLRIRAELGEEPVLRLGIEATDASVRHRNSALFPILAKRLLVVGTMQHSRDALRMLRRREVDLSLLLMNADRMVFRSWPPLDA